MCDAFLDKTKNKLRHGIAVAPITPKVTEQKSILLFTNFFQFSEFILPYGNNNQIIKADSLNLTLQG